MSFVTMKCYQMNSKDMLAACDVRIYVYTHLNLYVNILLDFWGTAELSKKRIKKEKDRACGRMIVGKNVHLKPILIENTKDRGQLCTAPIPNKIQHQEKGQQIKRMRIEKSSENIIIFGMSVAKRPRDISVSDDL